MFLDNIVPAGGRRDLDGRPTSEYQIWAAMKTRCTNSQTRAYKYYGARGICVCDRWMNSFDAFLLDMGPRPSKKHSIDREDNDGNYEPGNCRWATKEEQNANRRNAILIAGRPLAEVAADLGQSITTVRERKRRGWSDERILSVAGDGTKLGALEIDGFRKPLREWCSERGVPYGTAYSRLRAGHPPERALSKEKFGTHSGK